jgi:hypothetical protein
MDAPLAFPGNGKFRCNEGNHMFKVVSMPFLNGVLSQVRSLLLMVLAGSLLTGCLVEGQPATVAPANLAGVQGAEERLGIRVEALRRSADGYMLDFRYRVVDPDKARPILTRSIKPYVIDEASGAKFLIPSSPKVGALRQTTLQPEAGRVYWLLFANPARYIKPGSLVTVVVGDERLEHLVVE